MMSFKESICQGIPEHLPPSPPCKPSISRAPARALLLNESEQALALRNALRYIPKAWHEQLAPEFAQELKRDGRIYMHRLRPSYAMHARPLDDYPAKSKQAAAIMLMIQNNLDPAVAQYPYELITYGGNGTVFQNWAQYLLTMQYLSQMEEDQTLALYSGHPLGLFPSHADAPRVVVTNGMVIPNYSSPQDYSKMAALGVTSYGQMTAGSFMYIGPQGIVHGTTLTLINAARKYLGIASGDLAGRVYATSGLGGMSGAQAKAAVIAGAVGVIAEIDEAALLKRHEQGWLMEVERDLGSLTARVQEAVENKEAVSIGYVGNVVDMWEHFVECGLHVDLGSDQTSLHIPYEGGYFPVGMSVEESKEMMREDPSAFHDEVQKSLRRHYSAIEAMCAHGMHFWDYGNAFLLEASRADAQGACREDGTFVYPSYVQDIMGPMCFDYGFGPFRWVCASGDAQDLAQTDALARDVLLQMLEQAHPRVATQIRDNIRWIEQAAENHMVVGSQARILYADRQGRVRLARAFNEAIAQGVLSAPVILGRDHHDVSGVDSPFRETSNIYDGSAFTADMAVQNFVGDAIRGATWVSLHNGGGVGWGEVINGGFGLVLDGSEAAGRRADSMLGWDVSNGVARRAWARNDEAIFATQQAMEHVPGLRVTLPELASDDVIQRALSDAT